MNHGVAGGGSERRPGRGNGRREEAVMEGVFDDWVGWETGDDAYFLYQFEKGSGSREPQVGRAS